MKYLICQDWSNTSNNHAGIKHLCKHIEKNDSTYKTMVIPYGLNFANKRIRGVNKINFVWRYIATIKLYKYVLTQITDKDVIVFMEYMEHPAILTFAHKLRNKISGVKILGMVHLVPKRYDKRFDDKAFKTWINSVDGIITLGHSLTDYFIKRGCAANKLITLFHYVDNEYYSRNERTSNSGKTIKVIVMGNMMRDTDLLKNIIQITPNAFFVICQGKANLWSLFSEYKNVKLIPFVEEDELKQLMCESDISLNVMKDTIGSNVIVTSMAMGLAMICSDVGSIRDYCEEDFCIFCSNDNPKSFSAAINMLYEDKQKLIMMQNQAIEVAKQFHIKKFYHIFDEVIEKIM